MKLFIIILILFIYIPVSAQKNDSTLVGSVDGIVFDSIHNYVLQAATLAIYKAKDSTLVSYRLSNNFGEFHFKELPVGTPLTIVASFIGYKSFTKKFTISPKGKNLDLKSLILERGENILQEVIIRSVPPVTMNGDTLEFNADAFKLDKNAVVEDLMRKLPGITMWGDGTITVNGKKVNSVLVDGKPFFGSDTRVATQNLPKDAVDKIQVYQQNKNKDNPLDSVTDVNIKLKKNKQFGHFGKLSAGYGSDKHFETDANLNFFSPRTQMGVVGAANNINKVANDINTLMRNSTYKGVGASIEYQPDFTMQGINQPNSGGFTFQHDFIPNADYNNNNRLTANYFINNNNNKTSQNTQTITSLGGDSTQIQLINSNNRSSTTDQNFTTRYDKHKDNNTYYATTTLNANSINNYSVQQNSSYSSRLGLQSTNNLDNENHNNSKNVSLEAGITHNLDNTKISRLSGGFDINYSLNAGNNHINQNTKTAFNSISDLTQSRLVDRKYDNRSNDTKQNLTFKSENFSRWLLGYNKITSNIVMRLQNSLDVNTHNENNLVKDKDTTTGNYILNRYLTNNSRFTTTNEMPALFLSRSFYNDLVNRYQKTLSFNFSVQAQLYTQKNVSDHSFQNFTRSYQKFVPNASVSYNNNQYGDFQDIYTLSFLTSSDYPTVSQLFPLVDSSNLYYIQQGNPHLKPTNKRELSFILNHLSYTTKNAFNYNLSINAGITNNSFTDSSITDNLGHSTHYTINLYDSKYFDFSGILNKAFKFTNNQLQLSLSPLIKLTRTPNSINGVRNSSNNFNSSTTVNIYYSYKDWLAINLKQGYSYNHSKQSGINSIEFNNSTISSAFSASVNFIKRLDLSSNITYNRNMSTGSAVTNFTIWNANLKYRLFKENNAEIKFSALDLLHQNTSIINYGYNNTLIHGTANVLQQYFMVTLSYFPRRFGKKKE